MSDFVTITILSREGEAQSAFSERLSTFWTQVLRSAPDDFEKVFAEASEFESHKNQLSRQYLIEPDIADWLSDLVKQAGFAHQPIDLDDTYSKYESTPPDWMIIEH